MKIGILTYHFPENRNYGAMLQLYALYTTLSRMNHIPYVINYKFTKDTNFGLKGKVKNLLIKYFATSNFAKFSKTFLPNKTKLVDDKSANELNSELDLFIVGSDQVWRYNYVPHITNFFFDFVDDNHKKISYAASFGLDQWNEAPIEVTNQVKVLINRFEAVSVREKSGIDVCRKFDKEAQLVLDPVFLLSKSDYELLIKFDKKRKKQKNQYIAKMILDPITEYDDLISAFGKKTRTNIIDLNGTKLPFINHITNKKHSISHWLNLIKNSKLVITDSFHCIAFCIIFNKQFICLSNVQRGLSRLESLLEVLGLKNRIVTSLSENHFSESIHNIINFDQVQLRLNKLKEDSLTFLQTNIT